MNKKKILYLTTRLPYPIIGGDRLRMYNLLNQLKNLGYHITLVSLVTDEDDYKDLLEQNDFCDVLIPVKFNKKSAYLNALWAVFNDKPFIVQYFYSKAMQKVVDKLLNEQNFDVIFGYMIRIAPYLEKHKKKNIVIDFVDAVSMMYERRIKNVKSIWDKIKIGIEYLKVKHYEKKCSHIFKMQTVISQTDKTYIEKFSLNSNIKIISNGVDTKYYSPRNDSKKNKICFVGSMQYIPNSEAAMYFIEDVLPLVKERISDVEFYVIGANPRKELIELSRGKDYIKITGRVDDVRDYMKDCKVSVCPVKIAGGIQNKILEAMSMGIPVVTTPEGAEGIGADENILKVAKTNEDYAQKVIELILDKKVSEEISKNSRQFVLDNFSWEKAGNDCEKTILEGIYG